jgi:hypothetical protein
MSTGMLLFLEAFAMFIALLGSHVTVTWLNYWEPFAMSAVGLLGVASCCLAIFRRGRALRRLAILVALPSVLVISEWHFRLAHVLA